MEDTEMNVVEEVKETVKGGLQAGQIIAIGAGALALGYLGYRFVVKPVVRRVKAWKEAKKLENENPSN